MRTTVLLTATVRPHITSLLTITDPDQRLAQYRHAIASWVEVAAGSDVRLVIAENSGASLEELIGSRVHRLHADVRLVSVRPPDAAVVARGKGAAEAQLIDAAVLEVGLAADELLFKCTGRLFVRNFSALSRAWAPGARLLLDLPARRPLSWCDSRFFGGSGDAWSKDLSGMARVVDDERERVFEHVLAERAERIAVAAPGSVLNFRESPWIVGRSGTSGRTYSASRMKSTMRPVLRVPDRLRRLLTPAI